MSDFVAEPTVFRTSGAILGESLFFDGAESMFWCDITAGLVHRSPVGGAVDGSDDETFALPAPVASFHPAVIAGEAGFVVSLRDRVVLTDSAFVIVRELATIPHAHAGLRLNEGKVDPAGRWVTGSMNLTTGEPDGAIYSVDARSGPPTLRVLRGGLGVANGFEWSADGGTFYFTDTSVETVYAGGYTSSGDVSEDIVLLHGGPHDGLTLDTDGNFWGALYGEGAVVKYSGTGEEILRVELPTPNVTSVAFGGAGLSTLFVASARENLTEQQLVEHPLSGALFSIDTGTTGRLPNTFLTT
ncbi:SMP-30/gluconolactonase/LRE family protein [Subtercola endophyticus]|uniref:SMP-30/gluconolactonase/LRE family protein n=1 Tax=Subtercola endophyticus TaxID=2895559 RepID=UPI001E4DAC67|nr:SMP-30/gluconolactonase/LRE family protein [Subtercola endophyticus]UFS60444.1 SMP-30/gluconolactonase/LRE family protein [Subtercola endophyticus]